MDARTQPRKPVQERSRERVERVMDTAERLLERQGPEDTSIPEVALESGVPRASIYQYFPSKYALFLAIADRHLEAVAGLVEKVGGASGESTWEALVERACHGAAAYYNQHPVAGMLILGGPMSRNAYLAQETTIQEIGRRVRHIFLRNRPGLTIPETPDVMTLAVEIAFACMRHGYLADARISGATVEQASLAARSYLSNWLAPS